MSDIITAIVILLLLTTFTIVLPVIYYRYMIKRMNKVIEKLNE